MPLNKLENFIKNTEGRILYVNPNDLDATDGIENQGNSLTKPFKTLQRALIESARFSYLRGSDNDIVEKTTILLFPGEHLIDNRPGFAIKSVSNVATLVSPSGTQSFAQDTLTLTLNSNFDITQEDNILYKFNSIHGGIVVPRGTSIVGLDLRKTKIRPKYVPNPTDTNVPTSAIFRITGSCYFWQFSIFDGNELTKVYTDHQNFSETNQAKPTFSHHKLTVFEYADGVNNASGYDLSDLDMYYSKVSNAYNRASTREIDQKYPDQGDSFSKQRPEWEIVGAFKTDPINIAAIRAGDGATPGNVITVTTAAPHGLTADTPIRIRNVNVADFNITTKVQGVENSTTFTYLLPFVRDNLPAGPSAGLSASGASVTIETDTVSGASPYIFNCSLRSVWGMNGMHADGNKSSGFKSMVVAQFTGISLQKDDRAFVKYDAASRAYQRIDYQKKTGALLASESASTNTSTVYHLDPEAIYRTGWETSHVRLSNDATLQIVSVFAIGYNVHFDLESGSDASITNSNSNFGQFALSSDGFKKAAFTKDNIGYITNVITPRSIVTDEAQIEWLEFDVTATKANAKANHIYLLGYTKKDIKPPGIAQGYRIGARDTGGADKLYINDPSGGTDYSATIRMINNPIDTTNSFLATGTNSARKGYENVTCRDGIFQLTSVHTLQNGESIVIRSESADLPENVEPHKVYYAVTNVKNADRTDNVTLTNSQIQLASSKTNADARTPVVINAFTGGDQLRIESRVVDKEVGEIGHPIQWDPDKNQWFIYAVSPSGATGIWDGTNTSHIGTLTTNRTDISFILRKEDDRSLDEKIYKLRYVIPKEIENGRDPGDGFIIQESSSTGVRSIDDFTLTTLSGDKTQYNYNRNPKFIKSTSYNSVNKLITVVTDRVHNLKVDDQINVKGVTSSTNSSGTDNIGFNGTYQVREIINDKSFAYASTDTSGVVHNTGSASTNNTNVRDTTLPRIERNDLQENFYVYRSEVITPYQYNVQDGVYYLYVLNSGNSIPTEFTSLNYSQSVEDLYPQLDKDNYQDNPPSAVSYAKRFPLGDVVTSNQKNSITRESLDKFNLAFDQGTKISSVSDSTTTATLTFQTEHQLSGISTGTISGTNSGHTNGSFYNVRLLNSNGSSWDGATADVTVAGGAVTGVTIVEGGSGYTNGEQLYFEAGASGIGGALSARYTLANAGIITATGNYVQVTGVSTATDSYYRIDSCTTTKELVIKKTATDTILPGQYAIDMGPVVPVTRASYTNGVATFNSTNPGEPHGLVGGNAIRIITSSDALVGDYIVDSVVDTDTFTVKADTDPGTTSKFVLKHGISSNNATADDLGENLGTRGIAPYDHDQLILNETIGADASFKIKRPNNHPLGPNNGSYATARFPMGTYLQVDSEIMRITSSQLSGTGTDEITVIRGAMGTLIAEHSAGSLIKKIKPIAIELRRPSICRASGHTFEYVGYGPGNYSTSLPQVQIKTLNETEEFLAQAQERSCGQVVYTGMNNDGDFFVGNKKISSATGQEITFDIPIPTVTGEDPNRLSVVFDEVIVKERLLVEGGNSGKILSQFDGPVTFNGETRFNKKITIKKDLVVGTSGNATDGKVTLHNTAESNPANITCSTGTLDGAFQLKGGAAIGKKLNVCGDTKLFSTTASTSATTGALIVAGGVGISGAANITGNTTIGGTLNVTNNITGPGGTFGNIRIGITNDNEIDTSTGNLTLDSSGGKVHITDNCEIDGECDIDGQLEVKSTTDSTSKTTGAIIVSGGVGIAKNLYVGQDIIAFASSDERLKDNVTPIEDPLAKVLSISGNTFNWNSASSYEGKSDTGVIAQEVEKLGLPGLTTVRDDGTHAVNYEKLTALLIEAVKELSAKVDALSDK